MITLFIDTNVLLSFYHLTSEDIEELKKLVVLVEKKEIKDYRSQLSDNVFNEFLNDEWISKKKSSLLYYSKISDFFKECFPEIKIASQIEADLAINNLSNSGSFATTHICIAKLDAFKLTDLQHHFIPRHYLVCESGSDDLLTTTARFVSKIAGRAFPDPRLPPRVEHLMALQRERRSAGQRPYLDYDTGLRLKALPKTWPASWDMTT
jgi:hypothetical protein